MSFKIPLTLTGIEDAENLDGELKLDLVGTVLAGPRGPRGPRGLTGEKGEKGEAATFTIGSVQTAPAGTEASVEIVGEFPDYILNFVIPRGNKGEDGEVGPQGPPGTGTATVYRSPEDPEDDQGNDGDFWFVLK